jgi:hypothetical protein
MWERSCMCTYVCTCNTSSVQWVSVAIFRGVNWPGHEAECWRPFSSEVKNAWNYTSTVPYIFIKQFASVLFNPVGRQIFPSAFCQYNSDRFLCWFILGWFWFHISSRKRVPTWSKWLTRTSDEATTTSFRICKYLIDLLPLRSYTWKAWIQVWTNIEVSWDMTPCRLVIRPLEVITHTSLARNLFFLGFP